jgi:ribosomal-protein-alanine N-acetyltransferase
VRERIGQGKRIFLSPLLEDDIDDNYMSWFNDKDRIKYFSGSGRTFSRQELVSELTSSNQSRVMHQFGIFTNEDERLIGSIKIGPIDQINLVADLVAHVGDPAFHGKGIAPEAIQIGNRIAFENLGVRKLTSGIFAANRKAIRAYLGAGWVIEGQLRDHYLVEGEPMDRVLVSCFPSPGQKAQTT